MKNKKLLGILGITALLLAGNFAFKEAKEVDAAGKTIYLKLSGEWSQSTPEFTGWVWKGNGSGRWVEFSDSNADGILEASVNSDDTDIIFLRSKKGSAGWNEEWNRIQKKLPTNTQNLFSVSEWSDGSWGTYDLSSVNLMGTITDWETGSKLQSHNGLLKLSKTLAPGEYSFKLKCGDVWLGNNGEIEDTTAKTSTVGWAMNVNEGDCTLKASGGEYSFEYNVTTNMLVVNHKPYSEMLSDLVSNYVSDGVYTKVTSIYIDSESAALKSDLATMFHGKMSVEGLSKQLNKITYYNGDSLWMTNDQGVNSGYGTSTEGMTHFKLNNGVATVDYTVSGTTMEDYYVTPKDFAVDGYFDGWTYNSTAKQYELNVSEMSLPTNSQSRNILSDFIDVVAPLLYWEGSSNYFTYSKLVIKEDTSNNQLILQIVLDSTNAEGVLSQGDVLAEATITKGCSKTWTF